MNRRDRRAARVKVRHHHIDLVTALHEAGHAVGRYLTAPDMGFPEDEVIAEILVHTEGERPEIGTSIDGHMKVTSLAVCNGPMLSAELDALVPAAREKLGISATGTLSGRQSLDLKEVLTTGRAEGIDVNAWFEARAIIAVFGPTVEAMQREMAFADVWHGYEAESDYAGIVRDGVAAGLSPDEIAVVIETAVDRVLAYLQQTNVCNAVVVLGRHVHRHGTTSGKRAAAIIRNAMKAS